MDNKTIANTIWKQMNTIDKNLVWCMGTNKPTVIEQGLRFQVSGLSFKGTVEVTLDPNDTYRVKFIKTKRSLDKAYQQQYGIKRFNKEQLVVGEYSDVHVFDLMPLLENVVENRK